MSDEVDHKRLAELAVIAAEKKLLRASDFYERQAAQASLNRAMTWLEKERGDRG